MSAFRGRIERLARLACTACLLAALAPAAAAHPGHPSQAPVAPAGPDTTGSDGGGSALAIAGTVTGLLAIAGVLAWLKARDSRRRRIQIAVAGTAAVLSSAGLFLLFGPGGSEPQEPPNLASMQHVDGTLVVVEERRLVLDPFRPVDGRDQIEFEIREEDARHFDIAHLRSHSSVALPTRLYYERSGGRYVARYKEDAPANTSRAE